MNIGLTGLAGSGKDTVAVILDYEYGYRRLSFADPLKRLCLDMGWDGKKDDRGRKLLQTVGCAFRDYNSSFWVDRMHVSRELLSREPDELLVWTDVRFKNEAEYIQKTHFGVIVNVIRPDLSLTETHLHVSETEQASIPASYRIYNDGTKEELREKVKELVEKINTNE